MKSCSPFQPCVGEVTSTESLRHDAELNQMVARVVGDPVHEAKDQPPVKEDESDEKLVRSQVGLVWKHEKLMLQVFDYLHVITYERLFLLFFVGID